jgi:hypothetical protein
VLVEIDAAAERIVDARSTRRLVPLELADVAVPAGAGSRGAPVLFFRVLGRADGTLRVELWERGEFHGSRVLSASGENPQLVARRVALAAAELGRRVARKREAALLREQRERLARAARERAEQLQTQDGPLGLRSELSFGRVPGKLWLLGSRLTGELRLRGPLRLDVGGELGVGKLAAALPVALEGVTLAPAYRVRLTPALELDLGAGVSALLVQLPGAATLDAAPHQDTSWTARLQAGMRLELRLSRQLRALLGGEVGGLLRSVQFSRSESRLERLQGVWWATTLGVVVTPP